MRHIIFNSLINLLRAAAFASTGEKVLHNGQTVFNEPTPERLEDRTALLAVQYAYPKGFLEEIESVWNLSFQKVAEKGIVPVPSPLENQLCAEILNKTYGEMLADCADCFTWDGTKWIFALTTKDHPRGIILPLRENRKIVALKIYRHVQDRNSFVMDFDRAERQAA